MDLALGLIEGGYGRPWTWEERTDTLGFLAPRGYRFYMYAPKADVYLRRHWQELHPDDLAMDLAQFSRRCHALGVRFGIGLSPCDIFRSFDDAARAALTHKLAFLDRLGLDDLAIMFDDTRGDVPHLADRQADIVQFAAGRTGAKRVMVCPSYYSDDIMLDRIFGPRPDRYLEQLGKRLDPAIEIFWSGEEICSHNLTPGHLQRVAEGLGRKPLLWDNYPVNDTTRMSQYMHIRGFTGRPSGIGAHIAAHGINPALQPTLSRIPALTLIESYEQGGAYEYSAATLRASIEVLGDALGSMVHQDMLLLQDIGLDRLRDKKRLLRDRYSRVDHPGAREIIAWLDGRYRTTDAMLQTQ